jgi:sugar lactone lactonase YvrE
MKTLMFPCLCIAIILGIAQSSCKKQKQDNLPQTAGNVSVSTFAGSGNYGFAEGEAKSAAFYEPYDVAADANGNVYVADWRNTRIRKITAAGIVSTLAGNGDHGYADGNGSTAKFYNPEGIATDDQGNVFVADTYNNRIRKITNSGVVSTIAGSGVSGYEEGNGTTAKFAKPTGITTDGQGNLFVTDRFNYRIRKITSAGIVSTIAGNGIRGFANGNSTTGMFNDPIGIVVDSRQNIYVADAGNNRIRKVTPTGDLSTFAGSGEEGIADGNGSVAKFSGPYGIGIDAQDNIYIADAGNNCIRKITPSGVVSTLAGSLFSGYEDGKGSSAKFNSPFGVKTDKQGNVYVADWGNNRIRKISLQ